VHPGASSLLFSVVPEADLAATLEFVRAVRDRTRFGSGLNLPDYPKGVERVVAVDPSAEAYLRF
jgi:hypothetical protein